MRNGDGPVRDEERGTRELPGKGEDGPTGPRRLAEGVDGIPEQQARPHPEDIASAAAEEAPRREEPIDKDGREALSDSDGRQDPDVAAQRGSPGRSLGGRPRKGGGG